MNLDLNAIEQRAKAADAACDGQVWKRIWWGNETYPYPCSILSECEGFWMFRDGNTSSPEFSAFVEAAQPQTVIALIARVRELEGELSELRNTLYDQQRTAEAEHGQAMMDANGDPYA